MDLEMLKKDAAEKMLLHTNKVWSLAYKVMVSVG